MKDHIDRIVVAISDDGLFRALAVRSTLVCDELRRRHGTSDTATAALGRAITAAALMGATMDDGQAVTLRFIADGPSGGMIAEAMRLPGLVGVRGYIANPEVHLPLTVRGKLDVSGLIGSRGQLYVTKDLGMKEMYTGSAELRTGEVAEDVAYYYTVSEQLPTALSLGVRVGGRRKGSAPEGKESGAWVSGAGGVMIQAMPGTKESASSGALGALERSIEELGSVSLLLQEGLEPEELIERAFIKVLGGRVLDNIPLELKCRCSREKAVSTLIALGEEDLRDLSAKNPTTEVKCHFCGEVYRFSQDELLDLIGRDRPPAEA